MDKQKKNPDKLIGKPAIAPIFTLDPSKDPIPGEQLEVRLDEMRGLGEAREGRWQQRLQGRP